MVVQIFRLPNLQKPAYIADGIGFLPPFLSTDFAIRRSSAKEILSEILVAELGDSLHKTPYLIVCCRDHTDSIVPDISSFARQMTTSLFISHINPSLRTAEILLSDS